jgi:dienelactone hydrolase
MKCPVRIVFFVTFVIFYILSTKISVMKKLLLIQRSTLCTIMLVCFQGNYLVKSQTSTVNFMTSDKIMVTADLYTPNAATAPFIILFHQATYSRGEYLEIAPKLNSMGFNCIAVDLRSGESVNGITNQTFRFADSLGFQTRYVDSYNDMRAALAFVKRKYPGSKIILMGSSYSASLSIKLASDFPEGISGVVAFSPGEYFSKFGWSRDIIQTSATKIKCSVFITSSPEEKESWQKIYDAIPIQTKVSFVSDSGGKHGAKTLWNIFPESSVYWQALKSYLGRFLK